MKYVGRGGSIGRWNEKVGVREVWIRAKGLAGAGCESCAMDIIPAHRKHARYDRCESFDEHIAQERDSIRQRSGCQGRRRM